MTDQIVASALTTNKTHLPAASLSRITPATRTRAADQGEAMKDGSFPIRDGADLRRAIQAFGRAKDKGAAKRHIIRRARALDKVELLPDTWRVLALKEFPGQPAAPAVEPEDETIVPVPVAASAALEETLAKKAERHNATAHLDRRVSVAKLKTVYKRGVVDHVERPCVTPDQAAQARVNSFLRLLASGAPDSAYYTADNDLLPASHPLAGTESRPFV